MATPDIKVWNPGQRLLGGMYEVLPISPGHIYAEGGVGLVQRVRHREWAIELAVKSPKPGTLQTELGKQIFERECQTWIELHLHPNIVSCYMVRRIDEIPRLFSEFVPDGSLRDWLLNGRLYEGGDQLALERILDIGIQIAWGLNHAHNQNLLHLDVKPGNILMSGSTAKVTDFGLARILGAQNSSDRELYCEGMTPSFCSPEQYESFLRFQRAMVNREERTNTVIPDGETVPVVITKQSDIWSWAILILAMFYGRAPCRKGGQTADQVFETLIGKASDKLRIPFPRCLIEVIRQCLRKDPSQRPGSMDEIANQLLEIYLICTGKPYGRHKPSISLLTPEYLNNRAASLLALNRPEEASALFDEALHLNHWHPHILFNKVLTSWRAGRITDTEGLLQLEELVQSHRDDIEALFVLGLFQRERGNAQTAYELLDKAFNLDRERDDIANAFRFVVRDCKREVSLNGQFPVWYTGSPKRFDEVYIDKKQSYLVYPSGPHEITILELASGRPYLYFLENQNSDTPYRTFTSTNKQWELIFDQEDSLLIQNYPKMDEKRLKQRFRKVDWGRSRNSCDVDQTIRAVGRQQQIDLFDFQNGKKLKTLIGHDFPVTALFFSSDGDWLLSAASDASLRLWNSETGCCVRTLRRSKTALHGQTNSVEGIWISDKHQHVLSIESGGILYLWNIDLICNHPDRLHAPIMFCHVDGTEQLEIRQSELNELTEQAFQAGDRGDFSEALHWLRKGQDLKEWQSIRQTPSFAKWYLWLGRHTQRVSLSDAISLGTFQAHTQAISSLATSLDGRFTISAGKDNVIRLWDFNHDQKSASELDPTNTTLTTSRGMRQNYIIRELIGHTDSIQTLDITGDGRFAASGSLDQTIRLWYIPLGSELKVFPQRRKEITKIRFAPDGRALAIADQFGDIELQDSASGEIFRHWTAHEKEIRAIRFSRDGRYIISGSADRTVRIWSTCTSQLIRTFKLEHPISSVEISANLDFAFCGDEEGNIHVFDLLSLQKTPVRTIQAHCSCVTSLALFNDGNHISSGSSESGVGLWDYRTGDSIRLFEGNYGKISDLVLDFCGNQLIACTDDAYIHRWSLFWDYVYPGRIHTPEELDRALRIFIGFNLFQEEMVDEQLVPSRYYGDRAIELRPGLTGSALKLNKQSIQRIITELEYRGFGTIRPDLLHTQIQQILDCWPGFVSLASDQTES